MVIGILQFDLHILGAESLKDKRRVISSVKDRLHREHMVSIAEVALQDNIGIARLGLAIVGNDGKHVAQSLDQIAAKLRQTPGAELGAASREILHGQGAESAGAEPLPQAPDLVEELLRRADEATKPGAFQ